MNENDKGKGMGEEVLGREVRRWAEKNEERGMRIKRNVRAKS
jgi:hypothetical protein